MPVRIRELLLAWSVGLPLLVLDLWSKEWILTHFQEGEHRVVIEGFFNLVLVRNEGAAWGIFSGYAHGLTVFSAVVLVLLLGFHTKLFERRASHRVIFGLMLAGIIGNMVDRIRFQAVTDFLDFHIAGHHWPSFNVADSCICVAVFLYLILTWKPSPKDKVSSVPSVLER